MTPPVPEGKQPGRAQMSVVGQWVGTARHPPWPTTITNGVQLGGGGPTRDPEGREMGRAGGGAGPDLASLARRAAAHSPC
jgi:hypothetical protein